ncbi:MAG: energy transducer TonB [Deltaproteobacteria bacterium]
MESDQIVGARSPALAAPGETRRRRFANRSGRAVQRSAKRQASRERIHAKVVSPIDAPRLIRDPLERRESRVLSTLTSLRLLLGAAAIHALIILSFAFINLLIDSQPAFGPAERLTVSMVDVPAPVVEPPPVEEAPAEEGPIVPEFAPPPVVEKPRAPPRPVQAEVPPPVPDVVAQEPVQRRIVGLSLESTVQGEGPAFATGTSRMGRTERSAQDPKHAAVASGDEAHVADTATATQRVATRIPTRDAQFEKPKRMRQNEPAYPATLKAQGIEGDVLLRVSIDASGLVTGVSIVQSSGHADFDRAAQQAAREERFSPALRDGHPVAFTLTYSYRFRIQD